MLSRTPEPDVISFKIPCTPILKFLKSPPLFVFYCDDLRNTMATRSYHARCPRHWASLSPIYIYSRAIIQSHLVIFYGKYLPVLEFHSNIAQVTYRYIAKKKSAKCHILQCFLEICWLTKMCCAFLCMTVKGYWRELLSLEAKQYSEFGVSLKF